MVNSKIVLYKALIIYCNMENVKEPTPSLFLS
jgi:hypothetical protein